MKKLVFIFVVLLAFSAGVCAKDQVKPVVYAGGGICLPLGPTAFKDFWKAGGSFGGGIGIQINPKIEIIGRAYYSQHSIDDGKLPTGVTIEGGKIKLVAFGVDGKYSFSKNEEGIGFIPYIITGIGMTNIKIEKATVTAGSYVIPFSEESETKLGVNVGAGLDYMFTPKAGLWLEGRLAMVSTSGDSFVWLPIRAGVKLMFGGSGEK